MQSLGFGFWQSACRNTVATDFLAPPEGPLRAKSGHKVNHEGSSAVQRLPSPASQRTQNFRRRVVPVLGVGSPADSLDPHAVVQGDRLCGEQRTDYLDLPLACGKDHPARQIEGRVFGMISR